MSRTDDAATELPGTWLLPVIPTQRDDAGKDTGSGFAPFQMHPSVAMPLPPVRGAPP